MLISTSVDLLLDGFVQDGDAERRLVASAGDRNGDHGSGTVLLEEWIESFQEEGLCASHGLRELGLKAKMAVEIEIAIVE